MQIEEIVNKIKVQQDKMGYTAYINVGLKERMNYLRDISLSLIVEVVELLQELPFKPWKAIEDQPCNFAEAEKESIDIFVFLIDLMLILNPCIDLEGAITAVLQKIDSRIAERYGKQD